MAVSDEELQWCVEQLGIKTADFARLRQTRSSKAAQQLLDEIKLTTKRRFKQLSPQYHPDLNAGDPEKAARFRQLHEVYKDIQALTLPERVKARAVDGPYKFTAATRSGIIRVTVRSRS